VPGRYNASNLLGILGVLLASGVPLRRAVAALAALKPLPGRLQRLGGGARPLVVVDYAHTPDALQHALTTLREQLLGHGSPVTGHRSRLICVFGCGGERDPGKRPHMGRIAARLADRVVVTSDNPRGEVPGDIIRDIVAGVPGGARGVEVESDRRAAILRTVAQARRGDIVLLAGKGHERYQEIRGVRHPFSDAAVAREALSR
jgi:UDP-N-acetylmuramoyl-L-alanyl-D-glutamate--2,6-diaminopimelate ligase